MYKRQDLAEDESSPALVLVTHHLEEIPRGITHAMLLAEGGIVAAGPIHEILTNDALSATFGLPLGVSTEAGRWTARAIRR